jgi:hypothetical protein
MTSTATTAPAEITYREVLASVLGEAEAETVSAAQPGGIMLLELATEYARLTNEAHRHLRAIQSDVTRSLNANLMNGYAMERISSSSSLPQYEAAIASRCTVSRLLIHAMHAWREDRHAQVAPVTLTRGQLNEWAGFELTDDELARLDDAIPNSSIPEAVGVIADSIRENPGNIDD